MLALGLGLLVAQLLMAPPAGDMRDLGVYLTLSGAVTLGVGWLALRIADNTVGLKIQTKAFLSASIGSGVALLNVFVVAQLMFVSASHDLKLLVALLVFSGIVTIFFSLWIASTIAGRVATVAAGIRSLAIGDYGVSVPVGGRDEVAQLANDVNVLAQRLRAGKQEREMLERERRELTAAVSHDLRTPLASVRAMVEALADHVVGDPAEIERYYDTMRREIERLSRMIDDLFDLAQMDSGALRLDRQTVAVQDIAAEVVDAMQAQARRRQVDLSFSVQGHPPEVSVDGALVERAIANLLHNALAHTPAGGRIDVGVVAKEGWVDLCVSDTGDGIEEADLPLIWDRFYRAEKSRKRSPDIADGAGLGLAIVRSIVEAHDGLIDVKSSPGRGATFTVRLPIVHPA
jgi:signal transduction histidine kinase